MSAYYRIEIKLHDDYAKDNILKILQKGAEKGFVYYDQITHEKYLNIPQINSAEATDKIMVAFEKNIEGGPCVYTVLEEDGSNALLCFHKAEDGFLIFEIRAFGAAKKKTYFIDFAYYLRMFLDLVEDFQIVEVRTEMF